MVKKKEPKPENESHSVRLPIAWKTEGAPVLFANQMLVQTDDHEVHLSFFEIVPPLAFDKEALRQVESVEARCVGRVIISRGRLETFVNALQSTLSQMKDSEERRGSNNRKDK